MSEKPITLRFIKTLYCLCILLLLCMPLLEGQTPSTAQAKEPVAATQAAENPQQADSNNVKKPTTDESDVSLNKPVNKLTNHLIEKTLGDTYIRSKIDDVLKYPILGIKLGELIVSFTILLLTLIFRGFITLIIFKRLERFTLKTKFAYDEKLFGACEKPMSTLLLIVGFYIAIITLPLDAGILNLVSNAFRGLSMIVAVWALLRVTDVVAELMEETAGKNQSALHGFVPVFRKTIKVFFVVIGTLMVIDNFGYNIGGILATLGIGGAALAFASKDTIANGFGTLMIILDRPFKVGDWINVGNKVDGDVESIGLRSTKVRTFPKTVLSIPNGVLANEYVNNWSRMPKRRVKQYVGITYESTADDIEGLVNDIRDILKNDEEVNQDFILVNFTDFGDSSLNILVYYFTSTTNWLKFMDVQQKINLKIMRAVQARGLSIAFPTRSLYLEGPLASKMVKEPYQSRWDTQANTPSRPADEPHLPGDFGPMTPP